VRAFLAALRWDVVLQARNVFYWASVFVILVIGGLLLAEPEAARANGAVWVPAIIAVNLQITTFFFMAGLMLLELDEGTLTALAVSPLTPGGYLATRTVTLTALAAVETIVLLLIAFDAGRSWLLVLSGTSALGVIYTGIGAVVATRYASINALLLPASLVLTLLLAPLLAHVGFAPRSLFVLHPIEPAMTLMRAGYVPANPIELAFGAVGSLAWSALAFLWARRRVSRLMRNTHASGGR
jgi:fluoroquinolone transport system permease protein